MSRLRVVVVAVMSGFAAVLFIAGLTVGGQMVMVAIALVMGLVVAGTLVPPRKAL